MIGHREPGIGPAVTGLALNKGADRIRVGEDPELIPAPTGVVSSSGPAAAVEPK